MKKALSVLAVLLTMSGVSEAAVTATFQRVSHANTASLVTEVVNANLSGTYVTGGFTWNPLQIAGAPGSSPLPYGKVRGVEWLGLNGYSYVTTISNGVATTKIFTSGGTELANGAAVPDATGTLIIYLGL